MFSAKKEEFDAGTLTQWSTHGQYPDPPAPEFAGDARRWACRRTLVLQLPTNKADPVKSGAPKGQGLFKASAAITQKKIVLPTRK